MTIQRECWIFRIQEGEFDKDGGENSGGLETPVGAMYFFRIQEGEFDKDGGENSGGLETPDGAMYFANT